MIFVDCRCFGGNFYFVGNFGLKSEDIFLLNGLFDYNWYENYRLFIGREEYL